MLVEKYFQRGWANERKLHSELVDHRKKCKCGHTIVTLPAAKRHKEYIVCNWCGQRVYDDKQKQQEHDKKVERENFRMKMWGLL